MVWAARRLGAAVQRLVAVKTARPEFGNDPDFARTFVDEARIASCIQHPNVCGIFELGHERGFAYLVMEWSDGVTLSELVEALPGRMMSHAMAAKIVAAVCSGLHAAHELEDMDGTALHVIHRDVSPQNVLISTSGHIKVADFGVAKAAGQLHAPTQTGEVKGKLSYMAPEQVTSKDIDRRVDIFALGCVLYEATTGERPFHGVDALATMYKIIEAEPDRPSLKDPNYPSELEKIVMTALAKDPAQRYQSAEAMRAALDDWLHSTKSIVTEAQIGKIVMTAQAERIRAKNARIQSAIAKLDSDEPVENDLESSIEGTTDGGSMDASSISDGTLSGGAWANSGEGKGTSYRRYMLAGAAVALVAGAGAVVWMNRPQPTPAPAVTQTPTAKMDAPAPERITISVRAEPVQAEIRVDDGPPVPNPYILETTRDEKTHVVRVSAPGFVGAQQEVLFDRSQNVSVILAPEQKTQVAVGSRRGGGRPGPGPAPAAQPQTQPDNPPERVPGQLPPAPTSKKRRNIDTENPFDQE